MMRLPVGGCSSSRRSLAKIVRGPQDVMVRRRGTIFASIRGRDLGAAVATGADREGAKASFA